MFPQLQRHDEHTSKDEMKGRAGEMIRQSIRNDKRKIEKKGRASRLEQVNIYIYCLVMI